jgi:hypothetical protein
VILSDILPFEGKKGSIENVSSGPNVSVATTGAVDSSATLSVDDENSGKGKLSDKVSPGSMNGGIDEVSSASD